MKLKDLLIILVILQLSLFLYYVPGTLRYLSNIFNLSFYDFTDIFQYFNQFIVIIMNIIGIVGVVFYFIQDNNIYNRFLKFFLIHHTFTLICHLPFRLIRIFAPPSGNFTMEWYYHVFYLLSVFLAIISIMVYSNQKIRVLPAPVSNRSTRFLHFFIDRVYITLMIFSSGVYFFTSRYGFGGNDLYPIIGYFMIIIVPFFYYTICEAGFKQTLGKVLSGAYVRSANGQSPGFGKILGRSLCRYIPFEPFSFLSDPMAKWHDSISGTDVFYKTDVEFEEDALFDSLVTEE